MHYKPIQSVGSLLIAMALLTSTASAQIPGPEETPPAAPSTVEHAADLPAPVPVPTSVAPEVKPDPAFDRFVDRKLLGKAIRTLNSAQLTDVALQFLQGEAIIDAWDSLSPAQQAQVIAAGLDVRQLRQSYGRTESRTERNAPPAGTSWTLMLYLAADSDLERAIMDNLEELLRVGPPPGVKVVVLADRSPYDDNDNPADDGEEEEEGEKEENQKRRTNREIANAGDWSDAKIFEVQKDNLILLKDLGEVNTGDGRVLTEFLAFASTKYPAEHLGLILSGHGDAWQVGLCPDESAEETEDKAALHIVELRDAIQQGVGRPLDLVAFDCCLMANFEVFNALSKVALAIAASEEMSPGPGWNYPALMRNLSKNPRASGLEIGVAMGEGFADYFAKYRGYDWYDKTTFSVVDMQRWTPVEAALHRVSKGLSVFLTKDIDDTWSRIARAASNTREYSKGEGALLDLKHLADNLGAEFDNPALRGELEKLTQAIGQAVVFNYCGKQQVNSHGVTIYLPHRVFRFTLSDGSKGDAVDFEEWFEQYASLPLAESRHGWFPLVEQASRLAQMSRSTALLGELESELDDDVYDLSAKVLDVDNFDSAQFVLARHDADTTTIIGLSTIDPYYTDLLEPNQKGNLTAGWDGTWFTLSMGKQSMLCSDVTIDDSDEENRYIVVTAQIAISGEKGWKTVELAFLEEDTDEWSFSNAVLVDSNYAEIELYKGDRLRSLRIVVDDEEEKMVPDEQTIRIGNPDGLSLTLEPLPPGSYEIGIRMESSVWMNSSFM